MLAYSTRTHKFKEPASYSSYAADHFGSCQLGGGWWESPRILWMMEHLNKPDTDGRWPLSQSSGCPVRLSHSENVAPSVSAVSVEEEFSIPPAIFHSKSNVSAALFPGLLECHLVMGLLVCVVNGLLISQSSSGLSRLWFMGSVICVWFTPGSLWLQQGHPSALFMRSNGFCLFLDLLPLAPQLSEPVWVPQAGLTLTLCWSRPVAAIVLVLPATGSSWWMAWWPLPINPARPASLPAFLMTSSQAPLSFLSLSCLRGKEKGKKWKASPSPVLRELPLFPGSQSSQPHPHLWVPNTDNSQSLSPVTISSWTWNSVPKGAEGVWDT